MTKSLCPRFLLFNVDCGLVPVFCGQWSCERCRKALAAKWAIRTWSQIEEWGDAYFLTLTLWGSIKTPAEGYRKLPGLWDNFRRTMQKTEGDFSYLAFVEGQTKSRNGMPHFHVICASMPYGVRPKDLAVSCGFGYQTRLEVVQSKRGAWYVSKYVSKGDPAIPKGFRRVRPSQDWKPLPKLPNDYPKLIARKFRERDADYIMRCAAVLGRSPRQLEQMYREAMY